MLSVLLFPSRSGRNPVLCTKPHLPCPSGEDAQREYCRDRAACDPMDRDFPPFAIDLPDRGTSAFVQYPMSAGIETIILSRVRSLYSSNVTEKITLAMISPADGSAFRNLINPEVLRKDGS